ncbi:hypothetical protein C8Q73DRAFT_416486 [Cubamyces lactineus]|nr:hypothetical protein C8Q73DRAFT_416486 [Cubamyces lactineus]
MPARLTLPGFTFPGFLRGLRPRRAPRRDAAAPLTQSIRNSIHSQPASAALHLGIHTQTVRTVLMELELGGGGVAHSIVSFIKPTPLFARWSLERLEPGASTSHRSMLTLQSHKTFSNAGSEQRVGVRTYDDQESGSCIPGLCDAPMKSCRASAPASGTGHRRVLADCAASLDSTPYTRIAIWELPSSTSIPLIYLHTSYLSTSYACHDNVTMAPLGATRYRSCRTQASRSARRT